MHRGERRHESSFHNGLPNLCSLEIHLGLCHIKAYDDSVYELHINLIQPAQIPLGRLIDDQVSLISILENHKLSKVCF